tara:strand:- start:40 stop:534 length:495 start_codon:yes stop_codon:yes gene_type:complete
MKTISLVLLGCTLVSASYAQSISSGTQTPSISLNSSTSESALGNVSLNLKIYTEDKEKQNIAFLVQNTKSPFSVEHIEVEGNRLKPLKFSGTLEPLGEGTYQIAYTFSQTVSIEVETNSGSRVEYRDSGWKTVVEIVKDSELILMKNGETTYTLELSNSLIKSE